MAVPAAVLSILVQANTGGATRGLMRFNQQLGGTEAQSNKATRALGTFAKVGVIGAGIGLGYAVKKAADFEQQLDSLGSVSGATGREMERFRKQAMKAGADTKFSALDAAEAQTELAKGGLRVKQIMRGGLRAALALAAAGEMDLGDAAATTANALNLFGLEGKNSMKVADALAKAANATTADVTDFAMALRQSGGVAKTAGLSFSETVLALESLANAGTKNADAGTSLKTALIQLIKPTQKQQELAKKLNLEFLDADGNFKNLADVSKMLRDRLDGMTAAQRTATLATLAGTDGVRTLTSLYDAGPKKLEKWKKGLDESGTAAEVARRKMSNTKGALENLHGSIDTVAISIGEKLLPALAGYARELTHILNNTKLSGSEKVGKIGQLLAEAIGKGIAAAGAAAAKAAPHVAWAFVKAFMEADAWGKLAIGGAGAFLLKKLGVGAGIGKLLGRGGGGGLTGGAGGILKSAKPVPVFVTNPGFGGGKGGPGIPGALKGAAGSTALQAAARAVPLVAAGSIIAYIATKNNRNLPTGSGSGAGTSAKPVQDAAKGRPGLVAPKDAFKREIGTQIAPTKGMKDEGLAAAAAGMGQLAKRVRAARKEIAAMRAGSGADIDALAAKAKQQFKNIEDNIGLHTRKGRQIAANNFEAAATAIARSMAKGKTSSSKGMSAIEGLMRTHSKVGKERLTQNLIQAANNIKRSMDSGRIATKQGTEAIEALMVRALQNMGFSKAQALKVRSQKGKGGNLAVDGGGQLRPNQRGGPIMEGKLSGDSVPSVLERGEYVLNRNAVRKVGKKALDNINFSAAPRFQSGGSVSGMIAAANQVERAHFPYSWGGGHQGSPAPFGPFDCSGAVSYVLQHGGVNIPTSVSGALAGMGFPGPGKVTVFANPTHTFMRIGDKYFGTSGSNPGGGAGWFENPGASYLAGFTQRHFKASGQVSGVGGVPENISRMLVDGPDSLLKADVQGALDTARAGANERLKKLAAANAGGGDPGDPGFGGVGSGPWKQIEAAIAKARGWSLRDWNTLIAGESGGDPTATNPRSGAFGIGQFLGSTLDAYAKYGAKSHDPRDQIRAMAKYISDRYGTPSKALAFWNAQSPHYYKKGGPIGKLAYTGDSLGVGTLNPGGLKGKLGKIGLASAAEVGKTSSWGADHLKGLLKGADAGMLDMGTNDGTAGNLRPSIAAVKGMLKKRPLVMSTLDPQSTDVGHKNAAIKSKADVVVPWADMAQKYASDAVHPTGAGYSKRAQMIAAAVKKIRGGEDGEEDLPKRLTKTLTHGPLKKAFGKTLKFLRKKDSKKQRSKVLRMFEKRIKKVSGSIPASLQKQINTLTNDAAIYDEYATRAGSLTGDEEGAAPGVAKGRTEAQWLQAELMKLFLLRNKLVEAQAIVEKRRAMIAKLLERARKRLKTIGDRIKENEKQHKQIKKGMERMQKHPKQNRPHIKVAKKQLDGLEKNHKGLVNERTGLEKGIIPTLRGKASGLSTARGDLNEPLTTVQGLGAPMGRLKGLPALGVMGGQIFDVQMRLRDLAAPASSISDTSEDTSERADLLAQLLREANLRTAVSQKQYDVFKNFPAYGGQFATGGVVPGPIGEARTIIAHGGETVTPPGNGGANVQVIVGPGMEWLEKFIEVKVDGVTRKQARNAGRMLPGRGGGV